MAVKIGIAGGLGRMGRLLIQEVLQNPGHFTLGGVSARDRTKLEAELPSGCEALLTESPKTLVETSEVVIDFTAPELSLRHLHYAVEQGKKLVIGTTGFSDNHYKILEDAAETIPLLVTSNTCLGVAVLGKIAPLLKEALGPDFDLHIHEVHHRDKKDAPSGTALALASKLSPQGETKQDRAQDAGAAVTLSSSRVGGVIGDHDITFTSSAERITLSHRALDRRVFARGALKAAEWLSQQPPGLYGMDDVVQGGGF